MAEVIVRSVNGTLTQNIISGESGQHRFISDEPASLGGNDKGPTPYDLLLAALGSCTSMTLLMYAKRKNWVIDSITVTLSHQRVHAKDCSDCETQEGYIDKIMRTIQVEGPLDSAQKERLLYIAEHCPVHKTLQNEIKIHDSLT